MIDPPGTGAGCSTSTASSPSTSLSATRTCSSLRVGTFLPTKSARIGSSRWPRSTSTASWIAVGRPKSTSASSAERIVRPGEQHVVDEHDRPAGDVEVDPRLVDLGRLGPHADVVAVERDVEDADGQPHALDPLDLAGEPPGEVVPAGGDPDEREALGALVPLEDLVRDPRDGAADLLLLHQARGHERPPGERRAGWRGRGGS